MDDKEGKIRKGFYIEKELLETMQQCAKETDSKSLNEFVNEALEFYTSFVLSKKAEGYILKSFSNAFSAIVHDSENRMARMYFKIAVELAKLNNVVASTNDIDDIAMQKLHVKCLDEVKRINGTVSFEDAYKFQNDVE